jgi:hypothetical protein
VERLEGEVDVQDEQAGLQCFVMYYIIIVNILLSLLPLCGMRKACIIQGDLA